MPKAKRYEIVTGFNIIEDREKDPAGTRFEPGDGGVKTKSQWEKFLPKSEGSDKPLFKHLLMMEAFAEVVPEEDGADGEN